ncbi:MAG TPA: FAD-binding oxidoreductase, partial [Mycobacterium sp.]|nr:FAD-binding oxidoreductase [Mycobacterium sp.]
MTQPEELLPPMKWNAWGDPASAKPLSDGIRSLLKQAVGLEDSAREELAPDQVQLRPSALSKVHQDALAAIVGAEYCRTDDRDRLLHAGGKSTIDLLRRKDTGVQDAPDAILLPGDDDAVATILRYCSEHGIAVIPFGGGTNVVGGLNPTRGDFGAVVSLDLHRFDQLASLDEVSGQAVFGAGVTGPDAERLLGERGFSLGHFPQSFEYATLGGFAATRSSGQDSAGYGRFNDMVRGLRMITPAGTLDLGRGPESAAGPDLRQ